EAAAAARHGRDAGWTRGASVSRALRAADSASAIRFSSRVIDASSGSAICGASSAWISRTAATALATSALTRHGSPAAPTARLPPPRTPRRYDRLERIAKRIGRRLGWTKRQALGFQVGVLDRE